MEISQKRGSDMLLFLGILLIACQCTSAKVYEVGGNQAWNLSVDYNSWAKSQTFKVGDILNFTFENTRHDVVEVNSTEYANCTYSGSPVSTSPVSVTLEEAREYYFICTVANHCSYYAMKVAVNVTGSPASSPPKNSPSPSPNSPSPVSGPPPPATSSAPASGTQLLALLVAPFLCRLAFFF